jgi:hypothetical protein
MLDFGCWRIRALAQPSLDTHPFGFDIVEEFFQGVLIVLAALPSVNLLIGALQFDAKRGELPSFLLAKFTRNQELPDLCRRIPGRFGSSQPEPLRSQPALHRDQGQRS